ncbi:hypothetical protein JCM7686_1013 [Paracoccus aminophilus JCM 7686]|uniref:Uncharacterized protein n=1 Tax=Paracoccus aminophilus JCM 7686 TaxID=1367847 RepID=S5XSN0_PARAH|nr:hypothetical protein JCM7686_1013 [Paracoccus aminophilus JCM 7686]
MLTKVDRSPRRPAISAIPAILLPGGMGSGAGIADSRPKIAANSSRIAAKTPGIAGIAEIAAGGMPNSGNRPVSAPWSGLEFSEALSSPGDFGNILHKSGVAVLAQGFRSASWGSAISAIPAIRQKMPAIRLLFCCYSARPIRYSDERSCEPLLVGKWFRPAADAPHAQRGASPCSRSAAAHSHSRERG